MAKAPPNRRDSSPERVTSRETASVVLYRYRRTLPYAVELSAPYLTATPRGTFRSAPPYGLRRDRISYRIINRNCNVACVLCDVRGSVAVTRTETAC